MKVLGKAVLVWILVFSAMGSAQEAGYWRAMSTTAKGVTGDVQLTDEKIAINFTAFTIAQIRSLKPEESATAFDADGPAGVGHLYRLSIPAGKRFLKKNTLCGDEETQWMATYVKGRELQVAFFSGPTMPVFTTEALGNSAQLCGTFTYTR